MHSEDRPIHPTPGDGVVGAHLSALDDMEAIFGRPEPGRAAAPSAVAPLQPRRRPRSAVIAGLVALIAVALVFMVRTPGITATVATPKPSVMRGASPSPSAPPPAAAPADANGVEEIESTSLASLTLHRPTDTGVRADQPATAATAEPAPATVRPAMSREIVSPLPEQPAPATLVESAASRPSDPCSVRGNQDRSDCVAAALRRADFALRRAYYAAVEADVAPAALRHYRREWDRVRVYAVDDPQGTIENYRGMARDLDDLADRGEVDDRDGSR